MGINALTHRDDGTEVDVPVSEEDWQQWVSPGRTRNWMLDDPLIDWLQLYGRSRDYVPKQELASYNKTLDFAEFIFSKGNEFEAGILRLFQGQYEVTTIAREYREIRRLDKAHETFEAMRRGLSIIYQGVLWDAHNMTYGSPDFLVRSDVLRCLFPESVSEQAASAPALDLGDDGWHYIVLDIKYTTLHLNANGIELANDGSAPAYKAQMYIYNRMLGRLQGLEPPQSYLLGRGWERTQRRVTCRSSSAMDLLGPIPQEGTVTNQVPIAYAVEQALRWVRRVRTEGADWDLLPEPSVPELYPNMSNADEADMMFEVPPEMEPGIEEDTPAGQWVSVKKWLAGELKELTQLWQVGVRKRRQAHADGWFRWDAPGLTADAVGVSGESQNPILKRLLAVNTYNGTPVLPQRIENTRAEWHTPSAVEFYVDFEYCSDLDDDFSKLPEKGGQPLIFMIGCGHVEGGEWKFKSLVADHLTEDEELRIIREWVKHMSAVRDRLDPGNDKPRIFHWSKAEIISLETAYSSARARHGERADWPKDLNWYDFLTEVMRGEPVVVRGALGFGLKAVANAMHSHNIIETNWADSPVDGLGAMVGAWRSEEEAEKRGVPMTELPLMHEIVSYNEVDCKVMMEIVRYLRANH